MGCWTERGAVVDDELMGGYRCERLPGCCLAFNSKCLIAPRSEGDRPIGKEGDPLSYGLDNTLQRGLTRGWLIDTPAGVDCDTESSRVFQAAIVS
jgi:hypothetical protein